MPTPERFDDLRRTTDDHEQRLRMLERGFDAHGYQLGSLEGWRKDVGPVIADLDDAAEHDRRRRLQRHRYGLEFREWITLVIAAVAIVADHIFH